MKAAHGEEPPLVVDPFAGGGSIPLEALRLGCDAFASDLNPVACLILKVMLEDIPRHGLGARRRTAPRRGGDQAEAEKELADFYPKDPDGATPIAYLWARTVRCESPNCGAEIPLVRSFWLLQEAQAAKRALRIMVVRPPADGTADIEFESSSRRRRRMFQAARVTAAKATCIACGVLLSPETRAGAAYRTTRRRGRDIRRSEAAHRRGATSWR